MRRLDARVGSETVLAIGEGKRKLKCFNCNGDHYRSNCPEPAARCPKCKGTNHLEEHCRSVVLKDKFGRDRIKVTENRKGFASNVLLDNSRRDQLETQKEHIQKELDKLNQRVVRNPKPTEEMNIVLEEGAGPDEDGRASEPEDTASEVGEEEVFPCFASISLSGKGLATARVSFGPLATEAILDSGATVSMISPSDAGKFGVEVTNQVRTVRGIGGMVKVKICKPCPMTIGTKACTANFHVGNDADLPPIIGGRDILQNQIDLLYSQRLVGLGEMHEPVPLVLAAVGKGREDAGTGECDVEGESELNEILEELRAIEGRPTTGQADVTPVTIETNGVAPKRVGMRPVPEPLRPKVVEWARKMKNDGVLEDAPEAKHFRPLILLAKPDKKERMVIDYRERNRTLASHGYPLPRMDDIHRFLPATLGSV